MKIALKIKAEDFKKKLRIKDGRDGNDAVVDIPALVSQASAMTEARLSPFIPKAVMLDTPQQLVEKLQSLVDENRLDVSAIKGIDDLIKKIEKKIPIVGRGGTVPIMIQQSGTIKTKNTRVINFIGAMVTYSPDGITNVNISTGGSSTKSASLSSQCDGSNKIFTVPANSEFLALMGSDSPIIYDKTTDFSGSGTTTLTLSSGVNAPSLGANLILEYNL